MPNLSMGKIDMGKLPKNVHGQYEHLMYLGRRKYYWLMVFVGAFLFLAGGFV